jgi:hypothetical protein
MSPPLGRAALDKPIPAELVAEKFGEVTALEVISGGGEPLIALGGDGQVALAPLGDMGVGRPIWEARVDFRAAVLIWDGRVLWAGGPERPVGSVDDYDWESLHAGAFAALDADDGEPLVTGPLPADVAWGTGGVALVRFGSFLAAVGRSGCLHVLDPREPMAWRSAALSGSSLGIAHAAAVGDRVVYGFNRGGYRLHSVGQPGIDDGGSGT